MTRHLALAILVAVLGWPSPVRADSPCLDVQDGQGRKLSGVIATLASWKRMTDASGRVCFQNVPPGRYQVMLRFGQITGPCNIVSSQASTPCTLR